MQALKKLFFVFLFFLSGCGCASSSEMEIDNDNIYTYQLVIPEIKKDYDLLFLTDTHITIPDRFEPQKIKDYCTDRLSVFSKEYGIPSSEIFPAWINYANTSETDALLLGGDIIDCPSDSNIRYLDESFQNLKIPYIYTPGNHDWTYPWEYMTQ